MGWGCKLLALQAVVKSKGGKMSKTDCTRTRAIERGGLEALKAWAERAQLYKSKQQHQEDARADGACEASGSDSHSSSSSSSS